MEQQNNKPLTLGSLFDGSGGFPLGGVLSGIAPIWASEIEPFPVRVTTVRFPNMKHYGDISKLKGSEIEPVDIITFGSPCQDMSVAGKREGLDGSRSSLFYEAIRVITEMRESTDGKYPRYIVWENVPGAFSSNKGEDFRAVLEEICKIKDEQVSVPKPGKWENAGRIMGHGFSIAWRLLDAQYWGVPQRRQRIYLVADLDGRSAGKILFESEGLSGYSAKGFKSWQRAARRSAEGIGETGETDSLMFENHSQDTRYRGPLDVAQTVSSTFGTGGNNQPFVVERDGITAIEGNGSRPSHRGDGYKEADVMYTLNATEQHGVAYGIGRPAMNQGYNAQFSFQVEEEVEPTLVAAGASGVAHPKFSSSKASFFTSAEEELANTLVATDYKDPPIVNDENEEDYIVRRLTPTECARLQGFPDWWCDELGIDEPTEEDVAKWREVFDTHASAIGKGTKGKTDAQIKKWLKDPHSDSAEYKMWGNGVALPNVIFVLSGIKYYAENEQN